METNWNIDFIQTPRIKIWLQQEVTSSVQEDMLNQKTIGVTMTVIMLLNMWLILFFSSYKPFSVQSIYPIFVTSWWQPSLKKVKYIL